MLLLALNDCNADRLRNELGEPLRVKSADVDRDAEGLGDNVPPGALPDTDADEQRDGRVDTEPEKDLRSDAEPEGHALEVSD